MLLAGHMLALISIGLLGIPPARCASLKPEPVTIDLLEGQWHQFECVYDSDLDRANKFHELAATVQSCSQELTLAGDADKFKQTIVAAVLGKLSLMSESMKEDVFKGAAAPLVRSNPDHPMVRSGLVEVVASPEDTGRVALRIRGDANLTNGLCAVCSQTKGGFKYEAVKIESLRILKPPTAALAISGDSVTPAEASDVEKTDGRWEAREGSSARLSCTGEGASLTMRLFRNDELLEETNSDSLTYDIAKVARRNAGQYKCQAVSGLPFLVNQGSHTGSAALLLAVKFAPTFELEEIVRFTPVGQQEDIQVKILAYPPASLACQPKPDILEKMTDYNHQEFFGNYLLTLSNTESPANETEFQCTASNDVGKKGLSVKLTAKAPRPEITSGGGTSSWYNSYQLKWQHHVKANIDYYHVEILYKGENSTTKIEEFQPTTNLGPVAKVDQDDVSSPDKRLHSGVVFNLRPDTEHEIRLRSCNRHGCSEFSDPVVVRTQKQSAQAYNDPSNPVKATGLDKGAASVTRAPIFILLSVGVACCRNIF